MANVKALIRTTKTDKREVKLNFRLYDGKFELSYVSDILIQPDQWNRDKQEVKKSKYPNPKINETNFAVAEIKHLILEIYEREGKGLTSEYLKTEIDKHLHPEKYEQKKKNFFDTFEEFLLKHPLSDVRRNNYRVLLRALQRFELYTQLHVRGKRGFVLDIETLNADTLHAFSEFLSHEHEYNTKYPELYKSFPEKKSNEPRGANTIAVLFSKFSTFCNWCNRNDLTANKPFLKFSKPAEVYGTPYYLTIEERNQLYKHDFSAFPALEKQRDVFVFQCLIGCRVGDLYSLRKANVINGAIEYIAAKTKDEKPKTIRVPLNSIALEIVTKYAQLEGAQLLPLISVQKYNDAIKECFTVAEITRNVTILNPLTRQSEIKPLNEVASSHLARRTFCGNLYKKVKDPNLVGSLSGHAEGSKAFARYREIDEDMKKELVSMIE